MNQTASYGSQAKRGTWLTALAWLALLAGIVVGAIALAAPVGVWLGLWEFGTGFQLLFNIANPWGFRIALAAAITGVVLVVLAGVLGTGNGVRVGALAFVGALLAWAAYAVPEAYRPDESVPPIHDISSDTEDPPNFVAVLPLREDAPNSTEYGAGSPDMTPERLAELTRQAYPDVETVMLSVPPEEAFERALGAVEALGWDLVAAAPEDGRIEATDTTFWFRFKDDIVVRIRAADGGSEIDARSVSRVGIGDAGTNAARLREFFDVLEESG